MKPTNAKSDSSRWPIRRILPNQTNPWSSDIRLPTVPHPTKRTRCLSIRSDTSLIPIRQAGKNGDLCSNRTQLAGSDLPHADESPEEIDEAVEELEEVEEDDFSDHDKKSRFGGCDSRGPNAKRRGTVVRDGMLPVS